MGELLAIASQPTLTLDEPELIRLAQKGDQDAFARLVESYDNNVLRIAYNLLRSEDEARDVYRWFTPLLHLDISTKFVQYIKLAVQECGLGAEWVRPPRLPLAGEERKRVLKIIRDGIASRPK